MSPDVAPSVRARLLARAKAQREEFERTLVRYAAERLLYRLGMSPARERCILKGASLLTVWMPDPYRATRDVDVLSFGSPDDAAIRALVEEMSALRTLSWAKLTMCTLVVVALSYTGSITSAPTRLE